MAAEPTASVWPSIRTFVPGRRLQQALSAVAMFSTLRIANRDLSPAKY